MKIDKTVFTLGLASLVPLAFYAASKFMKKRKKIKKPTTFEMDEDTQWVIEFLDEMAADVKQMHKQMDAQGETLKRLETRVDNVNIRVDNFMGGK